jgi:hypothetical protein
MNVMADLFSEVEPPPVERSVYGTVPRATVAHADPVTSEVAAGAMNAPDASGQSEAKRNARAVARLVKIQPGSTAVELFARYQRDFAMQPAWSGLTRHDVSRRLPDAGKAGWVVRGAARECRVAETRQTTWLPVTGARI